MDLCARDEVVKWIGDRTIVLAGLNPEKLKHDEEHLDVIGGGVLIKVGGDHFIATAAHVSDYVSGTDPRHLYFFGRDNEYIQIADSTVVGGKIYHSHSPSLGRDFDRVDLSLIQLKPEFAAKMDKEWVNISRIRANHKLMDTDWYAVIGGIHSYSEVIEVSLEKKILHVGMAHIEGRRNDDGFHIDGIDRRLHYRLWIDFKNGELTLEEYVGLSGCGLWNVSGSIENVQLCGIVTRIHKLNDDGALIATQARYLNQLITTQQREKENGTE